MFAEVFSFSDQYVLSRQIFVLYFHLSVKGLSFYIRFYIRNQYFILSQRKYEIAITDNVLLSTLIREFLM